MNFREYVEVLIILIRSKGLNPKDFLLAEAYEWYNVGCLPPQTLRFMRK